MIDASAPSPSPAVVVPAGWPILDAAAWVGHSCWAELRFHQVLTDWLAIETSASLATVFWALRAHRAELAEAWHRRLPELREFPRPGFVKPSTAGERGFADLEALMDPAGGEARSAALTAALLAMADHYRAHAQVALGPADGPVADSLASALARTDFDLARLGSVRKAD